MFGYLIRLLRRIFCGDCLSRAEAADINRRLDLAIKEVEKIAGG